MNLMDILVVGILLIPMMVGVYGGLRKGFWMLLAALSAILGTVTLTQRIESIFLNLSGIGAENFPNAPAVPVLILQERPILAYLAAFTPLFISATLISGVFFLSTIINRMKSGRRVVRKNRLTGGFLGLFSGILFVLLFIGLMARLPWPPYGPVARNSIVFAFFETYLPKIVAAVSGGF